MGTQAGQDLETGVMQRPLGNAAFLSAPRDLLSLLSHTLQAHMSRGVPTHNGLSLPTSVTN